MCSVPKLCLILGNCKECNPPSASIHGIFQAWILEWVAISFSRKLVYIEWISNKVLLHCRGNNIQLFLFSYVRLFVTRGLPHARLPSPSPSPGVRSDSQPLSW